MASSPFLDLQMAYNPATRRADLVFDGKNFVWDRTAQTPLIIAIGSERRAEPDDVIPDTVDANGGGIGRPNPRRGWTGDAMDPQGRFIGSRLWLIANEHQTADTRIRAKGYAQQAIDGFSDYGVTPVADASWIAPGRLAVLAQIGGVQLKLPLSLV
jgi:phage gp46-like protein